MNDTRQCPTYEYPDEPLFAHTITCSTCETLQKQFFHKCAKCVYRSDEPHVFFDSIRTVRPRPAAALASAG